MRKSISLLLILLIAFTVLSACGDNQAKKPSDTKPDTEPAVTTPSPFDFSDDIVWESTYITTTKPQPDIVTVAPEEVKNVKSDPSRLTFSYYYPQDAYIRGASLEAASAVSGLGTRYLMYTPDEVLIKTLAGDDDVDIYFIAKGALQTFLEKGIYQAIDSDIVSDFNDSCFDYMTDLCRNEKGDVVAMPIQGTASFITYPQQAADEVPFTRESITYADDFEKLVREYSGGRTSYARGMGMFNAYNAQYNYFYCDFGNKKADYNTDLYKHIYHYLDGWTMYPDNHCPAPLGFVNYGIYQDAEMHKKIFDKDKTMFIICADYGDLFNNIAPDYESLTDGEKAVAAFNYRVPDFDLNDWRIIRDPIISDKVDKNFVGVTYAVINPNSKHYEAAVKALEYIAENYYDCIDGTYYASYPFIKKDKSDYPDRYHPEAQVFDDMFEIVENGVTILNSVPSERKDIDEYQAGRLSIDKAIAMYQREVDIWLNE